jgi:hypothetical protein
MSDWRIGKLNGIIVPLGWWRVRVTGRVFTDVAFLCFRRKRLRLGFYPGEGRPSRAEEGSKE